MIFKSIEQLEQLTPLQLAQEMRDMQEYRKELLDRAGEWAQKHQMLRLEMKSRLDILEFEVLLTEEDRINHFNHYDTLCRIH